MFLAQQPQQLALLWLLSHLWIGVSDDCSALHRRLLVSGSACQKGWIRPDGVLLE